jgi:hypothetical protein
MEKYLKEWLLHGKYSMNVDSCSQIFSGGRNMIRRDQNQEKTLKH